MKKLRCLFLSVIPLLAFVGLLMVPRTASADVITFNVTGTFGNGAVFSPGSTLTIDTTLGTATGSNLLISAGSNSPANTFTGVPNTDNGSFMTPFIWDLADGTDLMIYPVGASFQGFTGGAVCCVFYSNPPVWGYSNGSFDTVLTPTQVPEPADVSLLVIGLLGVARLTLRQKRLA